MTNPLVDLALFDKTAQDLANTAVQAQLGKFPDWVPRDGNSEMVLIETLSLIAAEVGYGIDRIPPAVTESMVRLFGVTRSAGTPPSVTVTFHLFDTLGHDIPAGTVVRLALDGGAVDFTTDVSGSAAIGVNTVTVPATGTMNTSSANGTTSGTTVEVISALSFVDTATLGSAVAAGADPETDIEWLTRGVEQFGRISQVLVVPSQFALFALTYTQVKRAFAVDNWNGTATTPGHTSVAVLGSNGAFVSTDDKAAIAADMQTRSTANLVVHVVDPTVTTVNVQAAVRALPQWDFDVVQQNVIDALNGYLSTDSWSWDATVRRNELISVIDRVDGVDYVSSMVSPASDVPLAGVAPLADLGSASISVS